MIRLSRVGKKKQATFKVIVSEKTKDTVGDYLELLGHYNPHTNIAELNQERIQYWLAKGAQPSGTVHNLLVDKKIITGEKIKVANIKKKKEGDKPAEKPVVAEKPAETPTPAAQKKEEHKVAVEDKKEEPTA